MVHVESSARCGLGDERGVAGYAPQALQVRNPPSGSSLIVHSKTPNRRSGFSLIEIVVGGAILMLLSGVAVPMVAERVDQGKIERAQAECDAIVRAIVLYKSEHGHYPGGAQEDPSNNYQGPGKMGFVALSVDLGGSSSKFDDFEFGVDPWGNPYCYHIYTKSNPYQDVVAYSMGPDETSQSWDGGVWNTGEFAGDDIGSMYDETSD